MPGTLTGDPNASFDATLDNINSNGTTPASPTEMNSRYQKLLDNLAALKKLKDDLEGDIDSEIQDLQNQLNSLGIGDISGLQSALDGKASTTQYLSNFQKIDNIFGGNVITVSARRRELAFESVLAPGQSNLFQMGGAYYFDVPSGRRLRLRRVRYLVSGFATDGGGGTPQPQLRIRTSTHDSFYGEEPSARVDVGASITLREGPDDVAVDVGFRNAPGASGNLVDVSFSYAVTFTIEPI